MVNEEAFRRLRDRIEAGGEDAQKAAYELMEEYWQELTGSARRKLCASRLRSRASPSDIFESVGWDFIEKATRGMISLVDRNEVKNLLFRMFRNRLVREHREKYGRRLKNLDSPRHKSEWHQVARADRQDVLQEKISFSVRFRLKMPLARKTPESGKWSTKKHSDG